MELSKKPTEIEKEIINSIKQVLNKHKLFIDISIETTANDEYAGQSCYIKNHVDYNDDGKAISKVIEIDLIQLLAENNLGE